MIIILKIKPESYTKKVDSTKERSTSTDLFLTEEELLGTLTTQTTMDSGGMDNFMEKVPLPGAMDPRTQEAMNMARKMVQEDSCILLERYTKVNGAMENKKARELCTMLIKTY